MQIQQIANSLRLHRRRELQSFPIVRQGICPLDETDATLSTAGVHAAAR